MIPSKKFEHSFWLEIASDAKGRLRKVRSLRQGLGDGTTPVNIPTRFYTGAESTSSKANRAIVPQIDSLLADCDRLDEVPL